MRSSMWCRLGLMSPCVVIVPACTALPSWNEPPPSQHARGTDGTDPGYAVYMWSSAGVGASECSLVLLNVEQRSERTVIATFPHPCQQAHALVGSEHGSGALVRFEIETPDLAEHTEVFYWLDYQARTPLKVSDLPRLPAEFQGIEPSFWVDGEGTPLAVVIDEKGNRPRNLRPAAMVHLSIPTLSWSEPVNDLLGAHLRLADTQESCFLREQGVNATIDGRSISLRPYDTTCSEAYRKLFPSAAPDDVSSSWRTLGGTGWWATCSTRDGFRYGAIARLRGQGTPDLVDFGKHYLHVVDNDVWLLVHVPSGGDSNPWNYAIVVDSDGVAHSLGDGSYGACWWPPSILPPH